MLFPAVRHELFFWHGSSRLAGDLVLPDRRGPHPVMVIVGESMATERDRSAWLDGLAAAGIACFTWDRGVSSDPGRDPLRRAADHAREVLSAMNRLRCEPELDPDAIALLGWGDGGWAAAQAATFSSEVRALVLAGTPTASPAQLLEHRVVQDLRAAGHAGAEVAAARDVVRRRLAAVVAGGCPAEDLDAPRHDLEPWFERLRGHRAFAGASVDDLSADPLPTLSAVRAPVLALFGEQDPTLPLEESVRGVRDALRGAGHDDHRVAVVRGADHALHVRPGHGLGRLVDGRHQFGEWPVGLTDVIVEWLEARLRTRDDVPAYPPPGGADAVAWPAGTSGARGEPGPSGRSAAAHGGPLPIRQLRRRIAR